MNDEIRALLEDTLVAEVLVLANLLKAPAGSSTSSDMIPEAVRLIRQKKAGVLQRLAGTE